LVASIREGWAPVVTESNAIGIPVVANDVNGLRDSVLDGTNGILVNGKDPEPLARHTLEILTGKVMLNRLSVNALEHSRQFSWDKTFEYYTSQINNMI
jgi:D-inositol-3-phosphate glycosyltransferase